MSRGSGSLAYAVRGSALLRSYGELCLALVGIALVPALFALFEGDLRFASRAVVVGLTLATLGWTSVRIRGVRGLQSNEALVVVALAYLVTPVLMSWPMSSSGLPPIDALFHSVSAITTTGLSTSGSVEGRPAAFLFAQAWMQWYGGLVVIVLAVLITGPGPEARQLSGAEQEDLDLAAGTRVRARWALAVYSALTLIGYLVLTVLGGSGLDALTHALSGISTGGFSSHDDSLAGLGPWRLQAGLMTLALAGAIPLARYRSLVSRGSPGETRFRAFFDRETLGLLIACAIVTATLLATLSVSHGMPWTAALRAAPLLAISAQSTAGFTPLDVASLDEPSKLVLVLSMFIGGGLGSTAGGIKIFRVLVLVRLIQLIVLRPALPRHAVVQAGPGGTRLADADLRQAVGVVALFGGTVLGSWFAFLAHGHPALDSLFEVVSATGTVGLSTGLSAPALEPALKIVLCLDMWMGRLEILAVLVLLHPRTWIGRRASKS